MWNVDGSIWSIPMAQMHQSGCVRRPWRRRPPVPIWLPMEYRRGCRRCSVGMTAWQRRWKKPRRWKKSIRLKELRRPPLTLTSTQSDTGGFFLLPPIIYTILCGLCPRACSPFTVHPLLASLFIYYFYSMILVTSPLTLIKFFLKSSQASFIGLRISFGSHSSNFWSDWWERFTFEANHFRCLDHFQNGALALLPCCGAAFYITILSLICW